MPNTKTTDLTTTELASVGGAGTGATSELQAGKNYLLAGGLGSKLVHRAQYSLGFMNFQAYSDTIAAAPGGHDYIEDLHRLRPSSADGK